MTTLAEDSIHAFAGMTTLAEDSIHAFAGMTSLAEDSIHAFAGMTSLAEDSDPLDRLRASQVRMTETTDAVDSIGA